MQNGTLRKALAVALSAVTAATLLTACSQKTNQPSSASASQASSQAQNVTLTFWHNYSAQTSENETLNKDLIPKFESENPGIKIKAVSYEWQDLHDKIISSSKAGTLPDVSRLDIAWMPEFQKAGVLMQLDGTMSDFSSVSSNLLENAMGTASIKGHYYGLALDTNTKMLFYSKQAFSDAGLSAPTTMGEFVTDVKKLSGKNKSGQQVWGLGEPALAGWNVLPYIWSNGGSITNDDYTKATGFVNSDKTIAAVQTLVDLVKGKDLTGFNSGDIPATDGFGTGRYAMLLDGPWKYSEMSGSYSSFQYGVVKMPAGEGRSVSVLGGEDIGILNKANQNAAWKFMKFMTDEYAQEALAKCGQLPANKAAISSSAVQGMNYAPFLEAIKTAKIRPPVSAWSEIDNDLTAAVTSAVKGQKTAKQAMDDLATQMDSLLSNQ